MSSATLYHISGFRSSRVLWAWRELERGGCDLPELRVHEFTDAEAFRTQKPDDFLALNRQGKVPTLVFEPESLVLFESVAIIQHLLRAFDVSSEPVLRVSHGRSPEALALAAHFDVLCVYTAGTADNTLATSSPIQRVLSDPTPGMRPETISANHAAWSQLVAPTLENFLGDGPYCFGLDRFTAADVVIGHTLSAARRKFPEWLAEFPRLEKHYDERIAVRPAFLEAYPMMKPKA